MDQALKFFETTVGRPATPAEQTGSVSLDVLLQLMDGKVAAAAHRRRLSRNPRSQLHLRQKKRQQLSRLVKGKRADLQPARCRAME